MATFLLTDVIRLKPNFFLLQGMLVGLRGNNLDYTYSLLTTTFPSINS